MTSIENGFCEKSFNTYQKKIYKIIKYIYIEFFYCKSNALMASFCDSTVTILTK